MIPLVFIADFLNCDVDYELITLHDPSRIVLDINGSILKGRNKFNLNKGLLYIKNIRGAQFTSNKVNVSDNVVRIVFDLKTDSNLFYLDIVPSGEDLKIYPKIG